MKSLFVIDKLLLSKLLKFGIVGCLGMIIDFGTTYLCKEILKINKFLSNGIGFILAATSNYFLNRKPPVKTGGVAKDIKNYRETLCKEVLPIFFL